MFASDPPTCIAMLRLFAEVLAKRAAAKVGLLPLPNETQQTLVDRLADKNVIGATQRSLFHDLRRAGNAAVHENRGDAGEALHQLKMARELGVWFQRSFGNNRKFARSIGGSMGFDSLTMIKWIRPRRRPVASWRSRPKGQEIRQIRD